MNERSPGDGSSGPNRQPDPRSDGIVFDEYDWQSVESPSVAVAEAVAAVTNRNVTVLPPLQHVVDADALDRVLRSADGPFVEISFEYAEASVTVTGDGRIEISAEVARD